MNEIRIPVNPTTSTVEVMNILDEVWVKYKGRIECPYLEVE